MRQPGYFFFILLLALPNVANGQVEWTDSTGKNSMMARFKTIEDEIVYLEKPDGSDFAIPLDKLSEESQELARFGYCNLFYKKGNDLLETGDTELALKSFKAGSDLGSEYASAMLAAMYMDGLYDTPKDYDKAFLYSKRAASRENLWGKTLLGLCYARGYGTEKDLEIGEAILRRCSNEGCTLADLYFEQKPERERLAAEAERDREILAEMERDKEVLAEIDRFFLDWRPKAEDVKKGLAAAAVVAALIGADAIFGGMDSQDDGSCSHCHGTQGAYRGFAGSEGFNPCPHCGGSGLEPRK